MSQFLKGLRIFSCAVDLIPVTAARIKGRAMSSSSTLPDLGLRHQTHVQVEVEETYENAIKLLNTLQSNAQTIALARKNQDFARAKRMTIGALETAGVTLDLLDTLDVVHVAGTKGKGMTCAFTESILRNAGLKTGFFSSPHLTAVRERIRIGGKPLSTDSFAKYFFTVYNRLSKLREPTSQIDMPHYFRFLTCMAFLVFIEEEVDVVVLEVGVGGRHDTTNVVRKPVVCGISSLGLEHQIILGKTLEEIAMQKAGVMKKGVPIYTVATHPPHIMELLRSHAQDCESPFNCVSPLDISNTSIKLGVDDGAVSRLNAALAVNLANEFLLRKFPHTFPTLPSNANGSAAELKYSEPENFLPFQIKGLESVKWDGRFQIFKHSEDVTYFLDGAHTIESLAVAMKWFENVSANSSIRILIFNLTGERSSHALLKPFAESKIFDMAVFCPFIGSEVKKSPDNWSALEEGTDHLTPCRKHADVWGSLQTTSKGHVCSSAEATIAFINNLTNQKTDNGNKNLNVSVMVTGSLHLVGTFLSVLDPNRNE